MPQICNMGQTALLPLWRKACWEIFRPEKSDSFGRVWTRKLWYQRSAYPWPAKPLSPELQKE
jgi:hypothetical protein